MQPFLFSAGLLAIVTGLAHSVMSEILIFRHIRKGTLVPAAAPAPLHERHIRIIWASWHALTVFGWGYAAVLLYLAFNFQSDPLQMFLAKAIVYSNLGGSLLVLVGTKGKHPGWIALLVVAILTWLGTNP